MKIIVFYHEDMETMKHARIPSSTELDRLLAHIAAGSHSHRNRVIVMLSYQAGMRAGEIALLKWSDILSANGSVKSEIVLRKETTKSNDSRIVYVNKTLQKELTDYLNSFETLPNIKQPFVKTQKGSAFTSQTLRQMLAKLYQDAGIDGASSHSGRRAFITKLATNCVSAKVIMTLAGHKNLTTTQQYIDVNDDMLRAAVENI